ncbi:MAG: hypothetical protein LBM98_05070 [Oscillospiraceae bacterium]|jgi:hypothetical protein|nr:hypothetical protein [Oscillospiraceae bacterium]
MNNYEGRTRRCLRQPWIASPHIINYVSQVRRRLRKDGQGEALPCPGAMRRDGGRGLRPRTARVHPPPLRRHPPLKRGGFRGFGRGVRPRTARGYHPAAYGGTPPRRGMDAPAPDAGEGGFETRPTFITRPATRVQPPVLIHYQLSIVNCQTPFPSWEGCRPQAAGCFPPQGATHVLPSKAPLFRGGGASVDAGGAATPVQTFRL